MTRKRSGRVNKPDAITYVSIASALTAQAAGSPIKLIGFKGVAPTVANVENGTVVYDVDFVTSNAPKPPTKAFVDYATSTAAAEVRKQKNPRAKRRSTSHPDAEAAISALADLAVVLDAHAVS